jgi:hypothetical protein
LHGQPMSAAPEQRLCSMERTIHIDDEIKPLSLSFRRKANSGAWAH